MIFVSGDSQQRTGRTGRKHGALCSKADHSCQHWDLPKPQRLCGITGSKLGLARRAKFDLQRCRRALLISSCILALRSECSNISSWRRQKIHEGYLSLVAIILSSPFHSHLFPTMTLPPFPVKGGDEAEPTLTGSSAVKSPGSFGHRADLVTY